MALLNPEEWEKFLENYPEVHVLQTNTWGELKSAFDWRSLRVAVGKSGAQILFKKLPLGLNVAYIPKGPIGEETEELWSEIDAVCRKNNAVFLKVEPDDWESAGDRLFQNDPGFTPSQPIQPRRTIVIPLEGSQEEWLGRMKQKTRYNIRLAEKKDIVVVQSSNVEAFYNLMLKTGERDGFGVHSRAYYQKAYDLFTKKGQCALFLAEFQGNPLAGLMAFVSGKRAWYFYGASNDEERQRMPTYLLQWEAMRWAAARGCNGYDLWGVPDFDEDYLETNFEQKSDDLWGVYRFKRGFGGRLYRSIGAWDKVYKPFWYKIYQIRMQGGLL
jgi:peptidoglycan pentaglycine glycine transferase (the first glycine)